MDALAALASVWVRPKSWMDEVLAQRFRGVEHRIARAAERANRDPNEVELIAVTKTVSPDVIKEAIGYGQRAFGENRVQEGLGKIAAVSQIIAGLEWHLIGHLQSNKARSAIEAFALIQSVDSLRLAGKLNDLAEKSNRRVAILIEVNVAQEASKSGFLEEELRFQSADLFRLTSLEFRGLMTVAPLVPNPEEVRAVFRQLRELRDAMQDKFPLPKFSQLSMGMTDDFEVAIEEGSTMVRVGRALFGDRPAVR
jgi:PLP dependent protein